VSLPEARASSWWRRILPVWYRLVALGGPFVRSWWRAYGFGNIVELQVAGRRTGRPRRILLGLLRAGDRWYLGHPNGHVGWTRNLEAAGTADLVIRWPARQLVRATLLPPGDARDEAILCTWQHPFPGNLVYRLARAHVRAVGVFFAIEPIPSP
jgi:F420H(2)-dependent quinone reductase